MGGADGNTGTDGWGTVNDNGTFGRSVDDLALWKMSDSGEEGSDIGGVDVAGLGVCGRDEGGGGGGR